MSHLLTFVLFNFVGAMGISTLSSYGSILLNHESMTRNVKFSSSENANSDIDTDFMKDLAKYTEDTEMMVRKNKNTKRKIEVL